MSFIKFDEREAEGEFCDTKLYVISRIPCKNIIKFNNNKLSKLSIQKMTFKISPDDL